MQGEAAYQQLAKYGWASPLNGCIEQAGFDFASEVQRQRSLAIAKLQETTNEAQSECRSNLG